MRRLTRRQRISAIALAVIAICFVTLDDAGGGLRNAHGGVRGAMGALYRSTDSVLGPTRRFVQGIPDVGSSRAEIDKLRRENTDLHRQLAASQAEAKSTAELNRLQLAADAGGLTIVPAKLIAFGPGEGFDWTATLDVGAGSGVAVDQTVTDGSAVVGRIIHVDSSSSVVLLAADPGSGIGVRDTRTGQLAVATGAGTAGFTLVPLDPSADLKVGDQLQTGPAGQSTYAAGLLVGTVIAVRASGDGTTQAALRAATSPTALDLVGVILHGGPNSAPRAVITPSGAEPATSPSAGAAQSAGHR
ncbi:MAG: rod shape-determining protein MreC [Actinobacteria bacterium]|nr:rod shape-determining protein MreC [Actinomycetota bacterium]